MKKLTKKGELDKSLSGSQNQLFETMNRNRISGFGKIKTGLFLLTISFCFSIFYSTESKAITITVTPVTCNGLSNGTAKVSLAASYLWSNGAVTQKITGLAAGTYTVTITRSGGATVTASAIITQPTAIAMNLTLTTPGQASATTTGGITSSPYQYRWSGAGTNTGWVTSKSNIVGLTVGKTYTVKVRDANLCSTAVTFVAVRLANETMITDEFVVNAFPNPTSGLLTIEIPNATDENYTVELYNIMGAKVYSTPASFSTVNKKQFDFTAFTKGIYTLKVSAGEKVRSMKIVLK